VPSPPQRTRGGALSRRLARIATIVGPLALGFGCASSPTTPSPDSALATPLPRRVDAPLVFVDGETTEYDVFFGPLRVGSLRYRTTAVSCDGRPAFELEGTTRPVSLFAPFFKAAGTMRTIVSTSDYRPIVASWTTRGTNSPRARLVAFDADAVRATTFEPEWTMSRVSRAPEAFDPQSAMFLLRALELPPPNEERRLLVFEGADPHLLTIRSEGSELVRLRPGDDELPALLVTLRDDRLELDGSLSKRPPVNELGVWLKDSPARPILKIEGRTPFGSVSIVLREPEAPPSQNRDA
jgi:hypothetical protein